MVVAPMRFEDIGKEIRELFSKFYNCGQVKTAIKSTPLLWGHSLRYEQTTDLASKEIKGFIETKYNYTPPAPFNYNLDIAQKWTSDNVIISEIGLLDQFQAGTKFSVIPVFDVKTRKFTNSVAGQYHNSNFTVRVEAGLDQSKPVLYPTVIATHDGWIAGGQFGLEAASSKTTVKGLILGYYGGNFSMFGNINEKGEVFASLYQNVSDINCETGFIFQLPYGGNDKTKVEAACGFNFDSKHRLQAKVNTQCQIELSYIKHFGSVAVSLAGQFDGKHLRGGANKIGLGIDVNA